MLAIYYHLFLLLNKKQVNRPTSSVGVGSVESDIKKRLPYLSDVQIDTILQSAKNQDVKETLDFLKFINPKNTEYRKVVIDNYNLYKEWLNIFDVIDKVPHFKALYDILSISNQTFESLMLRYKLLSQLVKEAQNNNQNINKEKVISSNNYLNDLVLQSFLSSLDMQITIPKGDYYFDNSMNLVEALSDTVIQINNDSSFATYKFWFETNIKDQLQDIVGTDNLFINSLKNGYKMDYKFKINIPIIKLGINMNNINVEPFKTNFNNIKLDFNKLSRVNIQGYPLTDLFTVYNFIVNKNMYGTDTLTKVLSDNVSNDSVLGKYYQYIGNNDYSNSIDLNTLDLYEYEDYLIKSAQTVYGSKLSNIYDKYIITICGHTFKRRG